MSSTPPRRSSSICFAIAAGVSRSFFEPEEGPRKCANEAKPEIAAVNSLAQWEIVDQAYEDLLVFVTQGNDPSGDTLRIVPRRHHEQRLVCPTPIEQAGGMCNAGGFHTLPGPLKQFDAAFLPNSPQQFFLRLEIVVDRRRLHFCG